MMLEILSVSDFEEFYSIMEESFPVDERREKEEQRALWDKEEYHVYGMKKEGLLLGFLAVWKLKNGCFLEHFAIDKAARNAGYGSNMLREFCEQEESVVLEVELPETELAKRRIAFYERNGFCYHDYEYMQPAISKGRKPVPLRIMAYPKELSKEEFDVQKTEIYRNVYHVKEA